MAAADPFPEKTRVLTGGSPFSSALAIVTSDSVELATVTSAIYVGVAGDVKVLTAAGDTATFKAAPVGILPIRARQVFATLTTATNMLALY